MHTLLTPLTIVIALVAVLVLANIITYLIVIGGTSSRYVGPVTGASTEPENSSLSDAEQIAYAKQHCECPCHRRPMHSGMRCLDCFGELCDEGTAQ